MNKAELIHALADKTGLTKADTEKTLNALVETVMDTVADGQEVALIGFHISCRNRLEEFNRGEHRHSHVWYRWYNEIPVVLLVAIVILVVLKPF